MKVLDYIICEDIRFEVRGKNTLIGVFHDSINIEVKDPAQLPWPLRMRLGVFIRLKIEGEIEVKKPAKFHLDFKLNEETLFVGDGDFTLNESPNIIMALPFGPFDLGIPSVGDFSFTLKILQEGKPEFIQKSPFTVPLRLRIVD